MTKANAVRTLTTLTGQRWYREDSSIRTEAFTYAETCQQVLDGLRYLQIKATMRFDKAGYAFLVLHASMVQS